MGCGYSNKDRKIIGEDLFSQVPINTIIYMIGEKYDDEITKVRNFVSNVEDLRHAIIDELDEISIITGNCSHNKLALNLKNCIISLAWKISTDNKGKFKNALMEYNEDNDCKIVFKGKLCSRNAIDASNYLFSYLGRVEKLKERIKELNKNKKEILKVLDMLIGISKQGLNKAKISNNIDNIKHSFQIFEEICEKIEIILNEGKEGIDYILDEKNHAEFDRIGLANFKSQTKIPHYIVWKNLNFTERTLGPKDGYYYLNELKVKKKRIKSEYRAIL